MAGLFYENSDYFIFNEKTQKLKKAAGICFSEMEEKEICDISKLIFDA
ncbi:MAG: hypothetical protein ACD_7C00372G0001 [uncultured bacterium]|nr:MAG: hypothetical protein ACD_7C00372G0001 [uncultured bacterium]